MVPTSLFCHRVFHVRRSIGHLSVTVFLSDGTSIGFLSLSVCFSAYYDLRMWDRSHLSDSETVRELDSYQASTCLPASNHYRDEITPVPLERVGIISVKSSVQVLLVCAKSWCGRCGVVCTGSNPGGRAQKRPLRVILRTSCHIPIDEIQAESGTDQSKLQCCRNPRPYYSLWETVP